MAELGVTGIKRTGGYIDEEFLPALRGRKAIEVFREMSPTTRWSARCCSPSTSWSARWSGRSVPLTRHEEGTAS
jgi:hypothetical protein